MIAALIGLLSTGVKGFFGAKGQQAETISRAMDVVSSVSDNDQAAKVAAATIISAEAQSGYWLAACWRPILMMIFAGIILARWFGFMPPNMTDEEIMRLYDLVELGIGAYIGGRSLEKIIGSVATSNVIKKLLG